MSVKVISGDNATSVDAVASTLAIPNADDPRDARDLPDDQERLADELETGTVFGRVTPIQKRAMVSALQSRGHTVAMTGDGDVLALKMRISSRWPASSPTWLSIHGVSASTCALITPGGRRPSSPS